MTIEVGYSMFFKFSIRYYSWSKKSSGPSNCAPLMQHVTIQLSGVIKNVSINWTWMAFKRIHLKSSIGRYFCIHLLFCNYLKKNCGTHFWEILNNCQLAYIFVALSLQNWHKGGCFPSWWQYRERCSNFDQLKNIVPFVTGICAVANGVLHALSE